MESKIKFSDTDLVMYAMAKTGQNKRASQFYSTLVKYFGSFAFDDKTQTIPTCSTTYGCLKKMKRSNGGSYYLYFDLLSKAGLISIKDKWVTILLPNSEITNKKLLHINCLIKIVSQLEKWMNLDTTKDHEKVLYENTIDFLNAQIFEAATVEVTDEATEIQENN